MKMQIREISKKTIHCRRSLAMAPAMVPIPSTDHNLIIFRQLSPGATYMVAFPPKLDT